MNKKGVMFSIIAVLISVLLVTIYSVSFESKLQNSVPQTNSRAELLDTLFLIVETNARIVIDSTVKKSLTELSKAQSQLYDENTLLPAQIDPECELQNMLNGDPVRILNQSFWENPNPPFEDTDLIMNIPGVIDTETTCVGVTGWFPSWNNRAILQKFTADSFTSSDKIFVSILHVGGGPDEVTIQILDSCKRVLAEYPEGPIPTSSSDCTATEYPLDKSVVYEKGETYYIYIKNKNNAAPAIVNMQNDVYPYSAAIYQNTKNETLSDIVPDSGINQSFSEFMGAYRTFLADNYNISSSYNLTNIRLSQEDPWSITLDGNLIINFNDRYFNVNKITSIKQKISILGLPDPIFSKYTSERAITKHNPENETSISIVDVVEMVGNGSYIKDTRSPSYLMRFINNTGFSRCCGFMTMIDNNTLVTEEIIPIQEHHYSSVGWMYLTGKEFCKGANETKVNNITGVPGLPTNFRLDDTTLVKFNISDSQATIRTWCP